MHSLPRDLERWSSKAACSQEACQATSWAGVSTGTCSEKLLSCLIFFFFVWTLSLCAVCHTAMLKVQWGMFSPSGSDSGCSVPHITHCSQFFISHLHLFYFWNTSQKYEMDPCFCQNFEDSFMPGSELATSLWVWPQHKNSQSKNRVLGEFIAM